MRLNSRKSSCLNNITIACVFFLLFILTTHAEAGEWVYVVKAGDTLIDVSQTFLKAPNRWPQLQERNHVPIPEHLQPGTKIHIPVAWLKKMDSVAEVVRIQGKAKLMAKDSDVSSMLVAGAQVHVGDTIETERESLLTLRFVDGSRLLVAENSKLTLNNLSLFGGTDMAQTVLFLHQGAVDTQVSHQSGPAAKYEIRTPAINLAVKGTDFRARVDSADNSTRSEVIGGRVLGVTKKGRVSLTAGYGTLALPGQIPIPPKKLLSAPDIGKLPVLLEKIPLRFKWQCDSLTHQYHAQIFTDRTFGQLLLDGVFKGCTAKWADLPDGKYVLRVREIDSDGLEGLNAEHDFVLKARPEAPFVTAPQDGKTVRGSNVSFEWTQPVNTQKFHLQLSDSSGFTKLFIDLPEFTGNIYKAELIPGKYFWRIASLTDKGDMGPYSDVYSFTLKKMPETPSVAPPAIDEKQLNFSWKAGGDGDKYQIQMADDSTFKHVLADQIVTEPQVSIPRPNSGGTYFLRIKTIEADGFAGAYGPAQSFEVPGSFLWWLGLPLLLLF